MDTAEAGPVVLYDVGMGIAANAVAAIQCALVTGARRDLHVVSFEKFTDGVKLALENSASFPFLQPLNTQIRTLIEKGSIEISSNIFWELRAGDFVQQSAVCGAPEIVFYDFYSPKQDPSLWNYQAFLHLFHKCASRLACGKPSTLTTYCSATAVRSAMMLAGFFVGTGKGTETKRETTIASSLLTELERPLSKAWLDKLERSSNPLPQDWPRDRKQEALQLIKGKVLP